MNKENKPSVLFLCTGNSCRSQMAEGWAKYLKSEQFDFYSGGIEAHGQNPNAITVMAEVGIDITGQASQTTDELPIQAFDFVVTVCGHAHEHCPYFPAKTKVVHVGFEDPPKLAQGLDEQEAILECYRKVRDEIKNFIEHIEQHLQ